MRFLGGTDDYSLKNVLAAAAAGIPTTEYVTAHAGRFAALAAPLAISFDDFVRTSSDPRHVPAVQRLWRRCAAAGDLYRRTYEGDYCVGCERFYTADELVDGHCPEHLTPVERVAEENWFFRLSRYQRHIERIVASGELAIHPRQFRDEVLAFVRRGLADISVSRSIRRARGWGVAVPGDDTQIVYVWFDALTNYLTSLDFGDPDSALYRQWWAEAERRVHVIGKGIVRFHAVYWPAFLASAGLPAPTHIEVHPYLTVDGAKISKSAAPGPGTRPRGPTELAARYGTDAVRWWFARDVSPIADTDFTERRLVRRANEDLANGLGNVTNRIRTLVARRGDGAHPTCDELAIPAVTELAGRVDAALAGFDHRLAAELILEAVDALNRDLELTKPWQLAASADAAAGAELDALLAQHLESARRIAVAAAPIVPGLSARLLDALAGAPTSGPLVARLDVAERGEAPPTPKPALRGRCAAWPGNAVHDRARVPS